LLDKKTGELLMKAMMKVMIVDAFLHDEHRKSELMWEYV
jgi:hypothetical protein